LRNRATRLANADSANLERSVDAARGQVVALQGLVEAVGWDALPEELRAVGLARLVNPSASLAELASLTDPPMAKSTVHRRLTRLAELARRQHETGTLTPPADPA
jgi:DNA-binding protein WhiA